MVVCSTFSILALFQYIKFCKHPFHNSQPLINWSINPSIMPLYTLFLQKLSFIDLINQCIPYWHNYVAFILLTCRHLGWRCWCCTRPRYLWQMLWQSPCFSKMSIQLQCACNIVLFRTCSPTRYDKCKHLIFRQWSWIYHNAHSSPGDSAVHYSMSYTRKPTQQELHNSRLDALLPFPNGGKVFGVL